MKLTYDYELVRKNAADFVNVYGPVKRLGTDDWNIGNLMIRGIFMEAILEGGKLADRMGWTGVELTVVTVTRPYDPLAVCNDPEKKSIVQMFFMRRGEGPERNLTVDIWNDFSITAR